VTNSCERSNKFQGSKNVAEISSPDELLTASEEGKLDYSRRINFHRSRIEQHIIPPLCILMKESHMTIFLASEEK
jgi:hypothetical protein